MSTRFWRMLSGMVRDSIPLIDIESLVEGGNETALIARRIRSACREYGFFYIVGHGVDEDLSRNLDRLAREFFARPLEDKLRIRMALGGRAWRGYFPVGQELTSGAPDQKEGIYFGRELSDEHPEVRSETPLHGQNLFPEEPEELRPTVLAYMERMTGLGQIVLEGIARSLDLPPDYFVERYTRDPLVLFRVFHYPPVPLADDAPWSVGEHTDYGLVTILRQDDCGGLEVKSPAGWIPAPPVEESLVVNVGDMLDRITGGYYRSTPHRVRNTSGRDRLSLPFFLDPNWNAEVRPIRAALLEDAAERWDHASVHEFRGTYGDYLLAKVSKVFPELRRDVF
jgi:isopenicillin N synthase-like dioxygenase